MSDECTQREYEIWRAALKAVASIYKGKQSTLVVALGDFRDQVQSLGSRAAFINNCQDIDSRIEQRKNAWVRSGKYPRLVPETVSPTAHTVEQLDALPRGAVVLDADDCAMQSYGDGQWSGSSREWGTGQVGLPARILWVPVGPAKEDLS